MNIHDDELGVGSIVDIGGGSLYIKDKEGYWVTLRPINTDTQWTLRELDPVRLIHQEERPVLDYPVGTVLRFNGGRSVVHRKDDGEWYFAGSDLGLDNVQMSEHIAQYGDEEELTA